MNDVQVIQKNDGEKIQWEQNDFVLSFDSDALAVNCSRYQKDWPVHLDICRDGSGNLSIGTAGATHYVAEIDIPATTYTPGNSEEDPPVADPLNMGDVTLTLWAIS